MRRRKRIAANYRVWFRWDAWARPMILRRQSPFWCRIKPVTSPVPF